MSRVPDRHPLRNRRFLVASGCRCSGVYEDGLHRAERLASQPPRALGVVGRLGRSREVEQRRDRARQERPHHPRPRVAAVRGVPYVELVGLAAERADLAVIGTTASGADAGFLIREEAEEVINLLEASIVAVKPEGFVSPVDAP